MDINKISVIINTYNAETHLKKVLDSVQGFDEILICDMESTDNTLNIAKEYNCTILTFPKGEHKIVEPARNFAIKNAKHPWVLVVDADELVPTKLKNYLYSTINKPTPPAGIYIPRKNYYNGKFIRSNYPDRILRFLKRDGANWPETIHSVPQVDGRVEKLSGDDTDLAFIHLANESIANRIGKINSYTDYEIERKKNRNYGALALISRPLFKFIKFYFIKKGFRDGISGLIRSCEASCYEFIVVAKILERNKIPQSNDLEKDINNI